MASVFALGTLSALCSDVFNLTHGWAKDPSDGLCKYGDLTGNYGCSPNYTGPVCTVKFGKTYVDAYNNAANCEAQTAVGILRSDAL